METIRIADGASYMAEIKKLIAEYADSLGRDLSFQNLTEELDDLSGKYAGANGRLLAALAEDGSVVGCAAFHRHSASRCEMKRLYVKPAYRHLHAGRLLAEGVIAAARQAGYREMVLDTIAPLKSAIKMYKGLGFQEIPAYYENPMPDVIYMKLEL
jgi:ribosomal protein S18 acetylase RimI-like enzyme